MRCIPKRIAGYIGRICAGMENQSVRIAVLSPSITTNILRMGAKGYKFKDCRCRCIVRHGTMFEGSNLPLRKWFYAICLFLSCKKDKQLSVGERDSRYFLLLRRKCAKAQSSLQTTWMSMTPLYENYGHKAVLHGRHIYVVNVTTRTW